MRKSSKDPNILQASDQNNSEDMKQAGIIDNIPLVREEGEYETAEWWELLEDYWNQVESLLPDDVVAWAGVSNYQPEEKKGGVIIFKDEVSST